MTELPFTWKQVRRLLRALILAGLVVGVLRHKIFVMTLRYTHVMEGRTHQAVDRVSEMLAPRPPEN